MGRIANHAATGALLGFLLGTFDGLFIFQMGDLSPRAGFLAECLNLGFIYALPAAVCVPLLGMASALLKDWDARQRHVAVVAGTGFAELALMGLREVNSAAAAGPLALTSLGLDAAVMAVCLAGAVLVSRVLAKSSVGGNVAAIGLAAMHLLLIAPLSWSVSSEIHRLEAVDVVQAPDDRPNILWITIDTLRADHLSSYGYERPTSPRIDAFAERSALFEQAFAAAPWTGPSTASFLTSLYPADHGCTHFRPLPGEITTFAEIATALGYECSIFSENPVMGPAFNLDQGAAQFYPIANGEWANEGAHRSLGLVRNSAAFLLGKEAIGATALTRLLHPLWFMGYRSLDQVPGEVVNDRVMDIFSGSDQSQMVYLHWVGPHDPYVSKPEYEDRFIDPTFEGERWMSTFGESIPPLDLDDSAPRAFRNIIDRYDASIRRYDDLVGDLLDRLDQAQLLDDMLVVILSDHGEEFLEHGFWKHGQSLYSEQLHVPLIMQLPGAETDRGQRIEGKVELVDVVPTLLDHLGAEVRTDPPFRGHSLRPVLRGEDPESGRYFYAQKDINLNQIDWAPEMPDSMRGEQFGLIDNDRGLMLIRYMDPEDSTSVLGFHLFDIKSDFSAQTDLWETDLLDEGTREHMIQLLESYASSRGSQLPSDAKNQEDLDDALRAMGYVE